MVRTVSLSGLFEYRLVDTVMHAVYDITLCVLSIVAVSCVWLLSLFVGVGGL